MLPRLQMFESNLETISKFTGRFENFKISQINFNQLKTNCQMKFNQMIRSTV